MFRRRRRVELHTESPMSIEAAKLLGCPFAIYADTSISELPPRKYDEPIYIYQYVPTTDGPILYYGYLPPNEMGVHSDRVWLPMSEIDTKFFEDISESRVLYRVTFKGEKA